VAIVNKVTKLFPDSGGTLNEDLIQAHIDEQNSEGYYMVGVDNLGGWYRFFWAKVIE
jgi:hypothetical protein